MNINELTIGQAKEIARLFHNTATPDIGLANDYIGRHVIIRTYSAGVWFGILSEKAGNEVIITNARRMWRWKTKKSISLSSVAKFGIDTEQSKITPELESVWLEAIEIMPTTKEATLSIMGADDVEAE